MHKQTQTELSDSLESIVDDWGLEEILQKLAQICDLKAEHLDYCYEDFSSSWGWNKSEQIILKAGLAIRKLKH